MADEQKDVLEKLARAVDDLNTKLDKQNQKIAELETNIAALESSRGKMPLATTPPPPPPPEYGELTRPADKVEEKSGLNKFAKDRTVAAREEISKLSKEQVVGKEKPKILFEKEVSDKKTSLEERIGGRWFAKIGIVVLVLGISFFLKYAFDNGWIGPTGRVILGVIAGLALLAWGEKTIRQYALYGQIVSGGGLAVLYLSVYAAFNFYHLISNFSAFAFLVLVTFVGIALSLRYAAPALMIVSALGGFATPVLASDGSNHQITLFIYIIMLDLSILVVSVFKRWHWLHLIGFVGTIAIFSAWFVKFYNTGQLFSTFFFLTAFFIIYSITSLVYNLVKKEKSTGIEQVMALVSGLVYFSLSYSLLNPDYHIYMGFFAFLLAVYYFFWAYLVRALTPQDENLYNFLAFLTVAFITVAIPIQFKAYAITLAWVAEAALLLILGAKLYDRTGEAVKIFGLVVGGLAVSRILALDYKLYGPDSRLFLNKAFSAAILAVAASYILAWVYKKYRGDRSKFESLFDYRRMAAGFVIAASVLTVFAVSRDIDRYYNNQVRNEYNRVDMINQTNNERYGSIAEYQEKVDFALIDGLKEQKEAAWMFFWMVYGLILLAIGVFRKRNYIIVMGLILMAWVVLRIFVYDLWQLDTIARSVIWILAAIFSYLTAALLREHRKIAGDDKFLEPKKIFAIFVIAANLLTIVAVSREIYLHFDQPLNDLRQEQMKACSRSYSKLGKLAPATNSTFDAEACQAAGEQVKRAENQASVAMSIWWLLYAIALLVVGFARRYKWVRIGGVALLFVAIIKLFFVDLWNLGQLYRIIASVSLGLVLLGISFMYQKYRHVFKEIIEN